MSDSNRKNDEVFDRLIARSDDSVDPNKKRLERVYNEEEPNIIKLRQDVANAIAVERQLELQLKNRKRKQFDSPDDDPEVASLETRLSAHREVKDQLKSKLTEREQTLQQVYDRKPGLIAAAIQEPKNIFVLIVSLVILSVVYKLFSQ